MKLAWSLIFASFLVPTAAAQTAGQTGSITGIVTDAASHMPVKKAMVSINGVGNGVGTIGGNSQSDQGHAAVTDTGGTFTIANLQPGQYQLVFQHQNYPQARFGGVTKRVDVKAGETTPPVNVELVPGAVVTGHVEDEDGDPMPACFIQPHPAKNPQQGVPITGNTNSNEDGEYRIYGIMPGKYVLTAQCQRPAFQPRPFSAGPEPPPAQAYPNTIRSPATPNRPKCLS